MFICFFQCFEATDAGITRVPDVVTIAAMDDLLLAVLTVIIHRDSPFFSLEYIIKKEVSHNLYIMMCVAAIAVHAIGHYWIYSYNSRFRENSSGYGGDLPIYNHIQEEFYDEYEKDVF